MTRYEKKDKGRKVSISQYKSLQGEVRCLCIESKKAEGDNNGWRENES